MTTANIYLNFDGNCEEAFEFYRSVLGGEFATLERYNTMPPQEGMPPIPPEMGEQIMHVSFPIGNGTVIMGSDSGGDWAPALAQGNNFAISLDTDIRDEADRLFAGLSAGGNVTMPMNETFWGSYFGMFTDKFGISWMISHSTAKPA